MAWYQSPKIYLHTTYQQRRFEILNNKTATAEERGSLINTAYESLFSILVDVCSKDIKLEYTKLQFCL
jgi:hypothetical protein